MPRGDKNQMEEYAFSIPTNMEQKRIAKFISILDERIRLQNKIIEKYESLIRQLAKRYCVQVNIGMNIDYVN